MTTPDTRSPERTPATDANTPEPSPVEPASGLAIASMVLGIISLTGPGLLLGIPAIIMAAIDLKKKPTNRGIAIAGLVTGIVSTVISLLVVGLVVFLAVWSSNNPKEFEDFYNDPPAAQKFQSAEL